MDLFHYTLQLADTALVLGQRMAEWTGHGPQLEQDIAMSNIALDLIGEARNVFQYACHIEGQARSEDDLAFFRDVRDFRNVLLVEQPNGDFAHTILRQFFFDAFHKPFLQALSRSSDDRLAAIAEKSAKEAAYHFKWSAEWVIRLGDGTDTSHQKMVDALPRLWKYTHELFTPTPLETQLVATGVAPNLAPIADTWHASVAAVFAQATLTVPDTGWQQHGGKTGTHTEHLGFILAEMQHLPRQHPDATW